MGRFTSFREVTRDHHFPFEALPEELTLRRAARPPPPPEDDGQTREAREARDARLKEQARGTGGGRGGHYAPTHSLLPTRPLVPTLPSAQSMLSSPCARIRARAFVLNTEGVAARVSEN